MGLLKRHLSLLAIEHEKHPIKGSVLTLGQQAVYATLDEVKSLFKKEKVSPRYLPPDFDTKTKIPAWRKTKYEDCTNCQTILTLLGANKVYATDISNYENADIIMDLNIPVDNKYHNKFDVILDFGTLEHIFNVPQALENIRLMCKPGGTIIFGMGVSGAINHGFYQICPTLYYDYFVINGFKNFSCFISEGSSLIGERKGRVYKCKHSAMSEPLTFSSGKGVEIVFFANKPINSVNNLKTHIPIQGVYNADPQWRGEAKLAHFKKKNLLRKFISYLFSISRKWRPEFIDQIIAVRRTKTKLIYIGKY